MSMQEHVGDALFTYKRIITMWERNMFVDMPMKMKCGQLSSWYYLVVCHGGS